MTRTDPDAHRVTATGIRIVGSRAMELAAEAAGQLDTPAPSDVLWISRFRARPRMGSGSPVPTLLHELGELLRQDWDACPSVSRDTPFARPAGRFHGVTWDTEGEPGAWRGELVWRHPHPVQAGTPCITHLVIDEQQQRTTVTLASAADGGLAGVRGVVGAGQARPALLDLFRKAVALTADGSDGTPSYLDDAAVVPFVRDVMLSETRAWPVAVLAPHEDNEFVVPPEEIANELFGLAPLFVIRNHRSTFRLTDELGDKRLSVYFGALRVYRPDFSCADRSDDHWLLLRERLEDPVERATLVGKVGRFVSARFLPVAGVREWREVTEHADADATAGTIASLQTEPGAGTPSLAAAAATASAESITPASTSAGAPISSEVAAALANLPASVQALAHHLRDLSGTIAHLVQANAQLADEIARLRTTTAIRAISSNALERRLGNIETLLSPPDESTEVEAEHDIVDEEDDTRPTLVDVVRHAGSEYGDALLVLNTAESTAHDSPYEDPDRVATVLQAMAYVARRRQEGGLESGLRAAFQELGLDYRAGIAKSTSERLRQQYNFSDGEGREYFCPEHIAIGSTYNPRRCLRIYFTSRAPSEPRFVIGHVGRHLTVKSSS